MTDKIHWRCFHCGETFTKVQSKWAAQHFGADESKTPVCLMRIPGEHHLLDALREAEEELSRWRSETMPLIAAVHAAQADTVRKVRRAEEIGYQKGIEDTRKYPSEVSEALIEAFSQLLNDMGTDGHSVCPAAKAQARIAFEPFLASLPVDDRPDVMSLAKAQAVIDDIRYSR